MRILMDVDNTIIPTWKLFAKGLLARNVSRADMNVTCYDFGCNSPRLVDEIFQEIFDDGSWMELPPYLGCVDMLTELVDCGHEIFYATNRAKYYKEPDRAYTELNSFLDAKGFPTPHGVYVVSSPEDKAALCREKGMSVAIEDAEMYVWPILQSGTPVILRRQPWNAHLSAMSFQDWNEFHNSNSTFELAVRLAARGGLGLFIDEMDCC